MNLGEDDSSKSKEYLGKYKRLKTLAEGQFGTVIKVKEIKTGRIFAMKEIFFNDKNKEKVEREIEIIGKFNHKNLLQMENFYINPPIARIITEICNQDLKGFLQKAIFPIQKIVKQSLAWDILCGLSVMHSKFVYHRDIKPGNIVIDSNFRAKIIDFGSAVEEKSKLEGKFLPEGFTLWYKSPEILMGKRNYKYEVDIWSFGCLFAELLYGAPIFAVSSELNLLGEIVNFLGSPDSKNWPELEQLPNFGKITFLKKDPTDFSKFFIEASEEEIAFLKRILKYGERPTAIELMSDPFFNSFSKDFKHLDIDSYKINIAKESYRMQTINLIT